MGAALAYDLSDPEPVVRDLAFPVSFERGRLAAQVLDRQLWSTFTSDKQMMFADLSTALSETMSEAWQTDGGAPASLDTFWRAVLFLVSIPVGVPRPEIMAEPTGDITFEWYEAPRKVLSVIVGARPALAYAALIDANTVRGTEIFASRFPVPLAALLKRIYVPAPKLPRHAGR